jgi:hypothetical protein
MGTVTKLVKDRVSLASYEMDVSTLIFAQDIVSFWETEGDPIEFLREEIRGGLRHDRSLAPVAHLLIDPAEVEEEGRRAWIRWAERRMGTSLPLEFSRPERVLEEDPAAAEEKMIFSAWTINPGWISTIVVSVPRGQITVHEVRIHGPKLLVLPIDQNSGSKSEIKIHEFPWYPKILGSTKVELLVSITGREKKGPVVAGVTWGEPVVLVLPVWALPFRRSILQKEGRSPKEAAPFHAYPPLRPEDPHCIVSLDANGVIGRGSAFSPSIPVPVPLAPGHMDYAGDICQDGTRLATFYYKLPKGSDCVERIAGMRISARQKMSFSISEGHIRGSPNLFHPLKVHLEKGEEVEIRNMIAFPVLLAPNFLEVRILIEEGDAEGIDLFAITQKLGPSNLVIKRVFG